MAKEIERKWLISQKNFEKFLDREEFFDDVTGFDTIEVADIEQIYLSIDPEVRIRKKTFKYCGVDYKITIKGDGGISRTEVEKSLTESEYEQLKSIVEDPDFKPITKKYVKFRIYGDFYAEFSKVDEGTEDEFSYMEIEFRTLEEANNYNGLRGIEAAEVTTIPAYKMKNYWRMTRGRTI